MPDGFTYELTLRDGRRHRTLEWPDGAVPAEVRPLLTALNERAAPTRS